MAKQLNKSRTQELKRKINLAGEWDTKNVIPMRKAIQIEGKTYPQMVLQELDQAEEMAKVKMNDFALENIMATGGESTLKEVMLMPQTLLEIDRNDYYAEKALQKANLEEWYQQVIKNSHKTETEE